MKLEDIVTKTNNLAEDLDEKELELIGKQVYQDYDNDEESRIEWLEKTEEWQKLALQVVEEKSYPWPGAANIKFPLLTTAALQFAARAYGSILGSTEVVKGRVIGFDPDGSKTQKAIRIGKHMSFQVLEQMPEWEEDMDKLFIALPILGCMFKKTYYDPLNERNCSRVIFPKDLVVNYYAKDIETASRITHIISMYKNEVKERQMNDIFLDIDLAKPTDSEIDLKENQRMGLTPPSTDDDTPYILLEQHCLLDLDEDGYKEPYIVTIEKSSHKVLRIVPRFDHDHIEYNSNSSLRRINPIEYFTKFDFIPNPEGCFYGVGFGILLGPINESVNTAINQIFDAGTLSNMQGGFLSRSIKLKAGEQFFRPGEWKSVNATGDDLRKSIVPLPTREPSSVLFQLLGLLIESAKEISTVSETMVGKMPGQNTPATTTMATIEQGQKVFTSIYKRIYRAMSKEFRKLFLLNSKYLTQDEEFTILGTSEGAAVKYDDYRDPNINVIPSADPNVATEEQKQAKANALLQLLPLGLNVDEVKRRVLEAQNQPGIEKLLQVPPPQPDPEIQLKQQEFQWKQQKEAAELQLTQQRDMYVAQLNEANAIQALAKAQMETMGQRLDMMAKQLEMFTSQVQDDHQRKVDIANLQLQKQQQEQQAQQAQMQQQQQVNSQQGE